MEDPKEESSSAGAMSMLASRNKGNRRRVIETFNRTDSTIQHPVNTRSFRTTSAMDRDSSKDLDGVPYRRSRTHAEDQETKQEEEEFRFDVPNNRPPFSEIEPGSWTGSPSPQASQSAPLLESVFKTAPPLQSICIRNEESNLMINGEEPDQFSIQKWWFLTDNESEVYSSAASKIDKPGVELSRPSVRFLKTVNAPDMETPDSKIAVCAQLYCALLTNFPKITIDEHRYYF